MNECNVHILNTLWNVKKNLLHVSVCFYKSFGSICYVKFYEKKSLIFVFFKMYVTVSILPWPFNLDCTDLGVHEVFEGNCVVSKNQRVNRNTSPGHDLIIFSIIIVFLSPCFPLK